MCVYLSELIHAKRIEPISKMIILNVCGYGCMRPTRLPRPLSGIAVCVVYHPPGLLQNDHLSLKEYLYSTIDLLSNRYPYSGLILLGDFNDLEITTSLQTRRNLKQVVQAPTRGPSTLGLIITNLSN